MSSPDGHQPRYRSTPAGLAAKAAVILFLCVAIVISWLGLGLFETSLWVAFAILAAAEAVLAGMLLLSSRWRSVGAGVAMALLAVYQAGESSSYELDRPTSADPIIPIHLFGSTFLALLAILLVVSGPAWPTRRARKAG